MPNLIASLRNLARFSRRLLALLILASAMAIVSPVLLTRRRKFSALSPLGIMLCDRLTALSRYPRVNMLLKEQEESSIRATLRYLGRPRRSNVRHLRWAVIAVYWALFTLIPTKAEITTSMALKKENSKFDAILTALTSVQATLASLGYLKRIETENTRKLNAHLVEQLRILRSWNNIMTKINIFTKDGDHEIVLEGSPGVTLYGNFKTNRMYLTCLGHLPTFCEMRAHNVVMKVKRTTEGFKPLKGGRW